MANEQTQSQGLSLTGGNKKQNQYLNYYNQLYGQLQQQYSQNITPITYQAIADPEKIAAQSITAPQKIEAERIDVGQHSYDEFANEAANYLSKYLDNSIAARRRQTGDARAAADVDAASRGMGGSTWLSDSKARMAAAEAADITSMQNNFLGQVGEQAFNAYQNYLNRDLQAQMQNAANKLTADQANAGYEFETGKFNAQSQMDVDKFNAENLLQVAIQNAANLLNVDMFNSQQQASMYSQLMQQAWQYAQQMYNLKKKSGGGGGKKTTEDPSGVTGNDDNNESNLNVVDDTQPSKPLRAGNTTVGGWSHTTK